MSFLSEEQLDFVKSRAQDWEESNGDPSARNKFWDQFCREWAERWVPTKKKFNHYIFELFRDEIERRAIARGELPKRKWVPMMSAPTVEEHERRRALKRARRAPSSSPEDLSSPDYSPSRSQSPGHDDVPTSPTAGGPHQPTPHAGVSSGAASSPEIPAALPPASSSQTPAALPLASSSQTPAALPPPHSCIRELTKSITIYLDLPGMTNDDVDLIFYGPTVTVSARHSEAAYEWSRDLGGPVIIDSVRAGLVNGQFYAFMIIDYTAEVDYSKTTDIPISDKCPW
ncbi:hypothetical protein EYR40_001634 [Pleurotus pulmonarius]|nr:hypothetical protein EYR36_000002 [Pleurotus pulmonarius]KAF4604457.1 hypothetical protein EYR38_004880 [Pleurotus pulmonarius]KAF4609280.1 hypothetical protein EYR40_001634 [Pleurotus pulmonarius]